MTSVYIYIQGVWLASLAHSLLMHAFQLCIYCMESYCWSHSIAWTTMVQRPTYPSSRGHISANKGAPCTRQISVAACWRMARPFGAKNDFCDSNANSTKTTYYSQKCFAVYTWLVFLDWVTVTQSKKTDGSHYSYEFYVDFLMLYVACVPVYVL